jgi:pimeloyl-ACP methyl ester carboxylesterase
MYVRIGGIQQWIEIVGADQDCPTLLYLHGGPGASSRPAAKAWLHWQEHFSVVHWDQRGAGRTFSRNGEVGCGALTIDRMVNDGIEIVDFLRHHLRCDKVLLVGHSWGSVLAVHMIKRHPGLFSAYVGAGQLVNKQKNEECNYRRQLAQAEQRQDAEALQALRELAPSLHLDRRKMRKLREWADKLADSTGDPVRPAPHPPNPDFTSDDRDALLRGAQFSRDQLFAELSAVDLPSLGPHFDIPMFFFQGTADQQTPIELTQQYFTEISTPHKEFVRFEGYHHFFVFNRPDDFLRELVTRVRPLV